MPFNSALTSGELIKLRGDDTTAPRYNKRVFISTLPNTNVYTAQIDQASFDTSLAELTYDNGSGTLADVAIGMLVLISHTDDRTAAFFRGRIRKAPDADTFFINETGAAFEDGDYIFVIDDYPLDIKLARRDAGVLKVDWDVPFRELRPIIYNLKTAYPDFIDGGSGVYQISFAPIVVAAASGATITTHLWDVGDGTITVGNSASQNITATFPPGFRHVSYTATDSNGTSTTRRIKVWAHDEGDNAPTPLEVDNIRITAETNANINEGAASGYNAAFDAFDGVSGLLDQTFICIWFDESYNGVSGSIVSTPAIMGRMRTQSDATDYEGGQRTSQAQLTVEGTLTQLSNLRGVSIESTDNASPDEFGEIDDFTIWRAIWFILSEFSTFDSLHSLNFTDFSDDFRYIGIATQGDTISDIISDLAQGINAVLQEAADGSCEVVRRAVMLTTSERNALTTIADMTTSDFYRISGRQKDQFPPIGLLRGDDGSYNTSSSALTVYDVAAPPGAPNSGAGEGTLRRQILKADQTPAEDKTEAKARAGHALAAQQNNETLPLALLDGWRFLTPSVDQWYTWTIPANHFVRGGALDTNTRFYLQALELSTTIGLSGIDITATFIQETSGAPGGIIVWPQLSVGEYPSGLGSFNIGSFNLPLPTSGITVDTDFTSSDGGWVADFGTYVVSSGWTPDCVSGSYELLDMTLSIGDPVTLTSITVTYDSTYAGGGGWFQWHLYQHRRS